MKIELKDYKGQSEIAAGTLKTFDIAMDTMPDKRMRTIRVWLPAQYDGVRRFPVLYMHDGQNLFSGLDDAWKWYVDREMKKVPESAQPIVVAIDTAKTRGEELCPPWEMTAWFSEKYPFGASKGEMYRDFVINTLKPLIDENFMTKPEKEFTGIGGSSMGGIQSFYMHTSRPDVFGRSLCFSVAFGVSEMAYWRQWVDQHADGVLNDRIFLYTGGQTADSTIVHPSVELYERMRDKGMDYHHICLVMDTREAHYESGWQKYFAEAVTYLFSRDNSVVLPPERPQKRG